MEIFDLISHRNWFLNMNTLLPAFVFCFRYILKNKSKYKVITKSKINFIIVKTILIDVK